MITNFNFTNHTQQQVGGNQPVNPPDNKMDEAETVSLVVNTRLSDAQWNVLNSKYSIIGRARWEILKNKKLKIYFPEVKQSNLSAVLKAMFKVLNAKDSTKYKKLDTKYKLNSLSAKKFEEAFKVYTEIADKDLKRFWENLRKRAKEQGLEINDDPKTADRIRNWFKNPKNSSKLENLRTLTFVNVNLKTLPPEIGKLKNLRTLALAHNELTVLTSEIKNLKNLQFLELASNRLETFPLEIVNLRSLEGIGLSCNNLKTLPREIVNLTNLKWLDLGGNKDLKTLPSEIAEALKKSGCEVHII